MDHSADSLLSLSFVFLPYLSGSTPLSGERQTRQENEQISGKCHRPIRFHTRSLSGGRLAARARSRRRITVNDFLISVALNEAAEL